MSRFYVCAAGLLTRILYVLATHSGLQVSPLDGPGPQTGPRPPASRRSSGPRSHPLVRRSAFEALTRPSSTPFEESASMLEQYASTAEALEVAVADTLQRHAAHHRHQREEPWGQVLFVVYSGSQFYTTRAKWIMETWGHNLPLANLVFVGDSPAVGPAAATALRGATVHVTACQPHSHQEGMCCKLAEAALLASGIMRQNGAFGWAYFMDDDAYVRPGAMSRHLLSQGPSTGSGLVLGIFGCTTDACQDGLCGGGGYAADAKAVSTLVGSDARAFLQDQLRSCDKCSGWADVALSRLFYDRALEVRHLEGVHGWRLKKPCFDDSLTDMEHEPLMYHYITSETQMQLLHMLFTASTSATVALVSQLAREERCATFRGSEQCSASANAADMPWDTTADKICKQR